MRPSIRMIDVGEKPITRRIAVARGEISVAQETADRLRQGRLPKGDALPTAQVAGILAAKRVDEWIPLCHTLPLDSVQVSLAVEGKRVVVEARVVSQGRTGVEMEALTAVSAACLTVYDMCKAIDKEMTIGPIYLIEKKGGRSGRYVRKTPVSQV